MGMADLTNYALNNQIELPYYLFHSAEELSLVISSGRVLDDSMEAWLGLLEGFIASKLVNFLCVRFIAFSVNFFSF